MSTSQCPKILVICGPTASGKSELAFRLAQELGAEIISADSMQVYRGMNIGTAKPTPDFLNAVPHHLIDIIDPDEPFSAADFARAADAAISDITARGKCCIVAGGTGLYIRALLNGLIDSPGRDITIRQSLQQHADKVGNNAMLELLRQVDPELASRLHSNNLVRIIRALEVQLLTGIPLSRYQSEHAFTEQRYKALKIGISMDRQLLYKNIDERVDRMLSGGLLEEVSCLLSGNYGRDLKSMCSIGYKEVAAYLHADLRLENLATLIKSNTRHYAKRQMTWFNAQADILWFEYPEKFVTIRQHVIEFFERREE